MEQLSYRSRLPRLYAAASLKPGGGVCTWDMAESLPRLYAAASLKPLGGHRAHDGRHRGLPRLYAAASLKQGRLIGPTKVRSVFRGFMPRPH